MKNILVLDDDKDFLDGVSTRLHRSLKDCAISTASDGAQGKEILASLSIDLVLTDLSMPVVNGYMLIEHAKQHYPSIPICVMTANCSPQIIERLRSIGIRKWIQKPFHFEQLVQMISEELEQSRPGSEVGA